MTCRTGFSNTILKQMIPRQYDQSMTDWLYQNFRSMLQSPVSVPGPAGPVGPVGPAGPAGPTGGGSVGGSRMIAQRGTVLTPPTIGPSVSTNIIFENPFEALPAFVCSTENFPVVVRRVSPTGATCDITGIEMPATQQFETPAIAGQCVNLMLHTIHGKPAVTYYNLATSTLQLFLALDEKGTQWDQGQTLLTIDKANIVVPHYLCVIGSGANAVVGLAYYIELEKRVMYLSSKDPLGTDWSNDAILIETIDNIQSMTLKITLSDINGVPGVAWQFRVGLTYSMKFAKLVNSTWQSWLCGISQEGIFANITLFTGIHVGVLDNVTFIVTSLVKDNYTSNYILALIVQDVNNPSIWSVVTSSIRAQATRMIQKSSIEYIVYIIADQNSTTMQSATINFTQPNTVSFGALTPFDLYGFMPLRDIVLSQLTSFTVIGGIPAIFTRQTFSANPLSFTYYEAKRIAISFAAFG